MSALPNKLSRGARHCISRRIEKRGAPNAGGSHEVAGDSFSKTANAKFLCTDLHLTARAAASGGAGCSADPIPSSGDRLAIHEPGSTVPGRARDRVKGPAVSRSLMTRTPAHCALRPAATPPEAAARARTFAKPCSSLPPSAAFPQHREALRLHHPLTRRGIAPARSRARRRLPQQQMRAIPQSPRHGPPVLRAG